MKMRFLENKFKIKNIVLQEEVARVLQWNLRILILIHQV